MKEIAEIQGALQAVVTGVEMLDRVAREQAAMLRDAIARATEAEQRAADMERRYDDAKDKANRTVQVETAATELLEALDRLPKSMEDAAMKRTVFPPDIPLYGTHDWQAVVDAKHNLAAVMRPAN